MDEKVALQRIKQGVLNHASTYTTQRYIALEE